MAEKEYIEREELIREVGSLEQLARKRVYDTPTNSPAYERYSTQYQERESMLSIIKAKPTADVVPKSEVERLKHQLEIIADEGEYWQGKFLVARSTVAREIFEEICEDCFDQFGFMDYESLAELKKKYTEEKQ